MSLESQLEQIAADSKIGSCTHRLQLPWIVPSRGSVHGLTTWANCSRQTQPITACHSIMWHVMTLTFVLCQRPRWLRSVAVVQHESWQCARAAMSWLQLSWSKFWQCAAGLTLTVGCFNFCGRHFEFESDFSYGMQQTLWPTPIWLWQTAE